MVSRLRFGRRGGLRILGGTAAIAATLGALLALSTADVLRLSSEVYLGLLAVGLFGGALANGYRGGHVAVSWLSAGIGILPMALAFAPSGPPEIDLTLVDILLKAGSWTVIVALVVGSVSHVLGRGARLGRLTRSAASDER